MIKRLLLALSLTLAIGCATGEIVVDTAPPAPKTEDRGRKPSGDVFWMDGHWAYDTSAKHFYWVVGRWASPRPGRIWQNAYWEPTPEGKYRWVPQRWDRSSDDEGE